jgi:hypothetical protein
VSPPQAQTFTPAFNYAIDVPLALDARLLEALASRELRVELLHQPPRSAAVAAALSRGLPGGGGPAAVPPVPLGAAGAPLRALLQKPGVCAVSLPADVT